ncbi:uncharacterized protein B0H18DRAFT_959766 [Fomitopsis serialis]|uniref:uncharacterized protein n=1 Tax=Fomitopsis serialis TaxID=139415 RepID=UPI00200827D1|nr:uncharacterized protein B0H18DRAFT_959766 [Neoantrodia serialis]KAH9914552.1 hypothetical protein B0H18DRAFT_959766 [Neoantrodia serialis]
MSGVGCPGSEAQSGKPDLGNLLSSEAKILWPADLLWMQFLSEHSLSADPLCMQISDVGRADRIALYDHRPTQQDCVGRSGNNASITCWIIRGDNGTLSAAQADFDCLMPRPTGQQSRVRPSADVGWPGNNSDPDWASVVDMWQNPFNALLVVTNRASPVHRDKMTPLNVYNILMTIRGDREQVIQFPTLHLRLPYHSGTVTHILCNGMYIAGQMCLLPVGTALENEQDWEAGGVVRHGKWLEIWHSVAIRFRVRPGKHRHNSVTSTSQWCSNTTLTYQYMTVSYDTTLDTTSAQTQWPGPLESHRTAMLPTRRHSLVWQHAKSSARPGYKYP